MKRETIQSLLLQGNLVLLNFEASLAGGFSGDIPLRLMPAKLSSFYTYGRPSPPFREQTTEKYFFLDKNQTDEHFDFDDSIDFSFDEDQEEDGAISAPKRHREEGGFQAILKWSETLQRYVIVLIRLPDKTVIQKTSPDSYFDEMENTYPDEMTNTGLTNLKLAPSPTGVYETSSSQPARLPRERPVISTDSNTETASSSHSDSSAQSTGTSPLETNPPPPSGSAEQPKNRFTPVPLAKITGEENYYRISNSVPPCDLTENGAKELQENNPVLFSTAKDAASAFDTLKQGEFQENIATEEYQAIARLLKKYDVADNLGHILNVSQDSAVNIYSVDLQELIIRNQLIPLQLNDEDTVLVICHNNHCAMKALTKAGAEELQKQYPNLFLSADEAILFFEVLGIAYCSLGYINTEQYQAIAWLIQQHEQNIGSVISSIFPPSQCGACVEKIPYGMVRYGFMALNEYDGEYFLPPHTRNAYQEFCDARKCLFRIKELIHKPDVDPEQKLQTLMLLFPPDDNDLTLQVFMQNTEYLVGDAYEKARESFLENADLQQEDLPATKRFSPSTP